ncbi:MAG: exodeoxyribonuclease VII small subunit [Saprospiraceae bacterium]|jgi:exodeoxyribonuclease VII small subunit
MTKKQAENQTYEQAMTELQQIVTDLQSEAVGIDELSDKVKKAAELINFCKTKLRSTEADIDQFFE